MKKNYFKLLVVLTSLIVSSGYSQNILLTLENSQITSDGTNDYYEADVIINTTDASSFKLGSGQLYFNYNTAAFGFNAASGTTITYDGSICGQEVDLGGPLIYGGFVTTDNNSSRISWSFSQIFASSTFANDNVTSTPTKLCHIKIQYVDVSQDPIITIEDGTLFDDQFFTACGPDTGAGGGGFTTADCTTYAGTQIVNDSFDSSGSALSTTLVFNEVFYDPPTGLAGDANNDGTRDPADDEFIELINNSGSSLDVSGYKIYDAVAGGLPTEQTLRHTIPGSTILPPNGVLLIFGGGTPTGTFGGATVFVADSGAGLSLNNSGEEIRVYDSTDKILLTFNTDAAVNEPDESYTRSPDITGTFVRHSTVSGFIFSPGTTLTSWTGNSNTNWATAANWSNGVPTGGSSVTIPNLANDPVASGTIDVFNVILTSGTALTVTGAVNNGGLITVDSEASLIAKTSVSGPIRYNRALGTNNWYLVSSPVSGETIEDLIANHTLDTGTGSNIGLAPYLNDGTAWDYQTSGSTGALRSGIGYSVKLASAGDLNLTGSMPVADVGIPITSNTNAYNLIGNPYPSYIPANINADLTNNILTTNLSNLSEATLWFWNQATSSYDLVNQTTAGTFIAPAQGFFVSSNGNNTFNITEAMQSHQAADSFQRIEADRPEIQLVMTDGSITKDADIFYIDGTTTGFDNGYDSSIFGGVANSFAVYTHAVANGEGRNLGIQSLPINNYENMIIPVGVNANAGTNITFTASVQNLPDGLKLFLEDTQTNTFNRLDLDGSDYSITLDNDMNGIGRFYLRTTSQTLSIGDVNLDNISMYTTADNRILNIEGLNDGKASLQLFDLTGKRILDASFQSNRVNTVPLPGLPAGVYIVRLQSENSRLNKRILID